MQILVQRKNGETRLSFEVTKADQKFDLFVLFFSFTLWLPALLINHTILLILCRSALILTREKTFGEMKFEAENEKEKSFLLLSVVHCRGVSWDFSCQSNMLCDVLWLLRWYLAQLLPFERYFCLHRDIEAANRRGNESWKGGSFSTSPFG